MNIYILSKKYSFLPVIILVFLMSTISGYILYQIFPKKEVNFTFFNLKKEKVTFYILESQETISYFNLNNQDADFYIKKIKSFSKNLKESGFNSKTISENEILSVPKNGIIISLDTYKVSYETLKNIKNFIKNGGTFIFNYHFGYFNDTNDFIGPKQIENLTNLRFITESISKENINFFVPNIMSPLIKTDISISKRYDLILYGSDTIPIFQSDYIPDLVLTNWAITSTPILNNNFLKTNQAGIAWHGFLGKGKWFYFSIPSYSLLEMKKDFFKTFFSNIVDFSKKDFVISKYPFIDSSKAVFISEDTEFKYKNMYSFALTAKKYNINVTLFCVAKLAEKYREITKNASEFPNVEIGSHSYSHTKILGEPIEKIIKEIKGSKEILEKITGKKVVGFRPPKEEIDIEIKNILIDSGYKYIMEKTKDFLLPKEVYKNLITIPRHGTDDYIYLINLDWDKNKILQKIIQETKFLTDIHALYTLSIHTHLLSYKSNLSISENYFKFLKKHPEIKPLKGIELNDKARLLPNISFKKEFYGNNIVITVYNKNENEIKNFSFRIFWPNIKIKKILPVDLTIKIRKIKENINRKYSDYKINKLKPNSATSFIINYEKIN